MRSRWLLRAALAVLATLAGSCKVALRVAVDTEADGGGEVVAVVTLDRDAQAYVGDLAGQLKVDDLTRSGWRVRGPEQIAKGAVRVTATKRFATPAEATAVVRELDGGQGMFEGFRLRQQRSFVKTTTRFEGRVDLRKGIEAFSDDDLRDELGSPLGVTPEQLSRRIGTSLADAFPITVGVRLPGEASSNAPQTSGGAAAWHPKLGEDVSLVASATKWNLPGIALASISAIAGALGAVSALRYRRTRAHR